MRNIKMIWFSRHAPTVEQLTDASRRGWEIFAISVGQELGAKDLQDEKDVWEIADTLTLLVATSGADGLVGVFPAPLRNLWYECPPAFQVWESWNVTRAEEGKKPTFAHRAWVRTV